LQLPLLLSFVLLGVKFLYRLKPLFIILNHILL